MTYFSKPFYHVDEVLTRWSLTERDLMWMAIVHFAFVITALLSALTDRWSKGVDHH